MQQSLIGLILRWDFLIWELIFIIKSARGAADRGVEFLRFQVSNVKILPKPARGLLGQKRGAIDNNYGR